MSDTPEIRPALTPEEWKAVVEKLTELRDAADWAADYHGSQGGAMAAGRLTRVICSIKEGTPFGFQHWMIDWLHERVWENVPREIQDACRVESDVDEYIANRIAALLSPREEE